MKLAKGRAVLCYIAAILTALIGFFGVSYAYMQAVSQGIGTSLLAYYLCNAVQQLFMFAAPALLLLAARAHRWQRFKSGLKPLNINTVGCCMLGAVSATVVVSMVVVLWQPWLESMTGYVPEDTPLPMPGNAGEWLLAVACIAVVPAVAEELLFRGFLQTALSKRFPRAALWITAFLFSAMHLELASLPALFVVGWVLGMLMMRHGLIASMFFHAAYNAVVLLLNNAGTSITLTGIFLCLAAFIFSMRMLMKEEKNDAVDGAGL